MLYCIFYKQLQCERWNILFKAAAIYFSIELQVISKTYFMQIYIRVYKVQFITQLNYELVILVEHITVNFR